MESKDDGILNNSILENLDVKTLGNFGNSEHGE